MKLTDRWGGMKRSLSRLEKQFGHGSIVCLGERPESAALQSISSGCAGLDTALGVGGFACGRISEIFGPESGGKTTLALQALVQAQGSGSHCAFIDAEHAFNAPYAVALGVRPERLWLARPDSAEHALEMCEALARSGEVRLVVLDSVAALVPRAEINAALNDETSGLQARLMSHAMRRLAGAAGQSGCVVLFVNQLRQQSDSTGAVVETTPGGQALKFYASVRLAVRTLGPLHHEGRVMGTRTRITVVKNKLAAPLGETDLDLLFGQGFSDGSVPRLRECAG